MRRLVGILTVTFAALCLALPAAAQEGSASIGEHLVVGDLLATVVYGFVGLFLAMVGYKVFDIITPFSLTKELVEDQNLAIGIVVGAMFMGTSIIVASAIL